MKIFTKYFATLFGIGFISIAPGTFGSLFAIFIWYVFIDLFSIFYFMVLFLFVLSVSFYFTDTYKNIHKEDGHFINGCWTPFLPFTRIKKPVMYLVEKSI